MPDYDYWRDQQDSATVTVDDQDLEVAYYDEGDGDPLVFLHGIPTSSFSGATSRRRLPTTTA